MSKLIKDFNKCDAFVLIWIVYQLQNILYSAGPINQIAQLIMIIWGLTSLPYFLKLPQMPALIKATFVLLLMYVIYGGLYILIGGNSKINSSVESYIYLQSALNSLLPIFLFYRFAQQGLVREDHLKFYLIIFVLVAIGNYNRDQQEMLKEAMSLGSSRTEFVSNVGYYFVVLFPMVFFWKRSITLQFVFIAIILVFSVLSLKRGAILVSVISLLYFIYKILLKRNTTFRVKLFTLIIIAISSYFLYDFVLQLLASNDLLIDRIIQTQMGDSSGRDEIYSVIWDQIWNHSSILQVIFGHGANGTVIDTGMLAHQDWLETTYNNGLVGFFILLAFFINFFTSTRKGKRCLESEMYWAYTMSFIVCFSITLMSMSIQNLLLPQTMLIGYFAAKTDIFKTSKYASCNQ